MFDYKHERLDFQHSKGIIFLSDIFFIYYIYLFSHSYMISSISI